MLRTCLAVSFAASILVSSDGLAYSDSVRTNCRSDYLTHCSQHEVGSPGLSACMRNVGPNLQPSCIDALVKSGEVSGAKTASPQALDAGKIKAEPGTSRTSKKAPIGEPAAQGKIQTVKVKQTANGKLAAKATQTVPLKQASKLLQGKTAKQVASLKQATKLTQSKKAQQAATAKLGKVALQKQQATKLVQGKTIKQSAKASLTVMNKQLVTPKQGKTVKQLAKASDTGTPHKAATLNRAATLAQTAKQKQALKAKTSVVLKQDVKAGPGSKFKKAAAVRPVNKANQGSAESN